MCGDLRYTSKVMFGIDVPYILCSILSFVPAIVFHEVAHGFAAWRLGDPTAKRAGRLSLNPLRHIDPFGTVIMPLALMLMSGPVFGYAKPVPYNPRYFKDVRKGELVVGLAGPAANLVMACFGALVAFAIYEAAPQAIYESYVSESLLYYLFFWYLPMFSLINLYFMFFNLLPVPPLDGSSIIGFFLPRRLLPKYYRVQQYALPVFLIVVILVPYMLNVNPIGIYLNATAYNVYDLLFSFLG